MFTSCGWFFDDISGIETVQVLQYAARAMQLAREAGAADLEPGYLAVLRSAASNVPEYGNGKAVFQRLVKPAAVDLLRVGAHYAVSSLFEKYADTAAFGAFTARGEACRIRRAGRQKVAVGRVRLRSEVILDEADIVFAALHLGDHNLMGGVREFQGEPALDSLRRRIEEAFGRGDTPGVIEVMDDAFGSHGYSLAHLFQDEKRKVIGQILDSTLKEVQAAFHRITEDNYPMMLALKNMGIPLPGFFSAPLRFILNRDLELLLQAAEVDAAGMAAIARDFGDWKLEPDRSALGYAATRRLNVLMSEAAREPGSPRPLRVADSLLASLDGLSLEIDLWKSQNIFFFSLRDRFGGMRDAADTGDRKARDWLEAAGSLARRLGIEIKS
jgi:hypothetical protein